MMVFAFKLYSYLSFQHLNCSTFRRGNAPFDRKKFTIGSGLFSSGGILSPLALPDRGIVLNVRVRGTHAMPGSARIRRVGGAKSTPHER